jgi:hypothetical protein
MVLEKSRKRRLWPWKLRSRGRKSKIRKKTRINWLREQMINRLREKM